MTWSGKKRALLILSRSRISLQRASELRIYRNNVDIFCFELTTQSVGLHKVFALSCFSALLIECSLLRR